MNLNVSMHSRNYLIAAMPVTVNMTDLKEAFNAGAGGAKSSLPAEFFAAVKAYFFGDIVKHEAGVAMKEIGRQFATFSNHESSHADKTNARAKAFQEIANLTSMVNRGSIADFKYLTNLLVGLFQESTPVLIPRAVKQSNAAPDTTIVKYDPGHPRPRGGNAAKQREALQREPGQQSNKAAPARSSSHSDGAERPLLTHQFRDSPMGRRPVAVYVPSYADILISEPVSSKSESPFTILEKEDQIKQNDDLGQSTELEERFKKLEAAGIDVSDARRQMAEAPDYDSE